jgi:hypothetical protein
MSINFKVFRLLFLSALVFLLVASVCQAKSEGFKKGVAHGTFMMQGYSGLEAPGTLRFYAEGAQAEESSLSYVDDAYISLDGDDYQGNSYELKGRFSGGLNGVATFVNYEGLSFSVPLKDGRTFDLSIPGVKVHMTVTDPSIFELDEDDMPAEYDPDAPLTDSGVKISDIDGQAEIACPPNFDQWNVLKKNMVIYNHCHLKTGEDSAIELSFMNTGAFKLNAETELVINESKKEKSKFQLLAGNIWVNIKKMVKDGTMEVHGSQAVAGIKGTTFMMEDTGASTTLKVVEGEVEFKDKAEGKTETVRTGEALSVDLRGFGAKTKFDASTEEKDQNAPASADKTKEPPQTALNKTGYLYWLIGLGIVFVAVAAGIVTRKKKKN